MTISASRLQISDAAPGIVAALLRVDRESAAALPDRRLLELVRYRASLLNGCAFCLDMHAREAIAAGEEPARLHMLGGWRDSPAFTDRERTALALTDATTRLQGGVPDDTWTAARAEFTDSELAGLVAAIAAINSWNRIAITTGLQPGHHVSPNH